MSEKRERDKFTHGEVDYEHPSKHFGQSCNGCEHFIRVMPPRCEGVKSPIAAKDWCRRFDGNKD